MTGRPTIRPPSAFDVPDATYRLQFHAGFDFAKAEAILPYLADLGISHVYASPFLTARAGSTHGYDITDHAHINPELGGEEAFERFVGKLHEVGLGLILDFVPNHMGVGGSDNPWWLDILEWGRFSPYARFFDIAWDRSETSLTDKVLLPVLGGAYGDILANGELVPRLDAETGSLDVWYYEHRFPIAPRDHASILARAAALLEGEGEGARDALLGLAGRFAQIGRGSPEIAHQATLRQEAASAKAELAALHRGDDAIRDAIDAAIAALGESQDDEPPPLHDLLERQSYRIAWWRAATDEINYRRFFDINDLAGLRMEEQDLFELSHRLVFRLIEQGALQGIRLDHVDGLFDPAVYCRRLRERVALIAASGETGVGGSPRPHLQRPVWITVEKILAPGEHVPPDWAVEGDTGYSFLAGVNALLVDESADAAMTRVVERFTGDGRTFEQHVVEARRRVVSTDLASETGVIAERLHGIAKAGLRTRDISANAIRRAIIGILSHFPVYRTYVADAGAGEWDRSTIETAVRQAREDDLGVDSTVLDFVEAILKGDHAPAVGDRFARDDVLAVARSFQQLSGPVAAKAVEDTAFYRYPRLISLNEVGGEPGHFGTTVDAFQRSLSERTATAPHALVATATHDHKRGEDTRARIAVLSEMPDEWAERVERWRAMTVRETPNAPSAAEEYLIYQSILGAWPVDGEGLPGEDFAERIRAYAEKAAREAKIDTLWTRPDEEYEAARNAWVLALFDPGSSQRFLDDIGDFAHALDLPGAVNGLSQTLLRLTAPGVPDTYQGTEFWDQSLVDPDNRRPVDYARRAKALAADEGTAAADLLANWRDGRVKLRIIRAMLHHRCRHPFLYANGVCLPIKTPPAVEAHLLAFRRIHEDRELVVVVPRLVRSMLNQAEVPHVPPAYWGDAALAIDPGPWTNVLTGGMVEAPTLAAILSDFPVAALSRST